MVSMRPPELVGLFNRLKQTAAFDEVSFDDVNATSVEGDNALHWAARQNDLAAARLLTEAGINIDQHGDLGRTPLHEAASFGHRDMVLLLIQSGADVHARTEGDVPFELARRNGHTEICDLLRSLTEKESQADPHYWTKVKIDLLRREIARLEKLLT
jgi:ankyrin repeat protein